MYFSKAIITTSALALMLAACGGSSEQTAGVSGAQGMGGGGMGEGMGGGGMGEGMGAGGMGEGMGAGMGTGMGAGGGMGAANNDAAMGAAAVAGFITAPLIDPNTASQAALSAIPALGESGAAKIIAARPFTTPSELHAAISEGMSEADLKSVYSATFIKVGLNSGAEDDYKLVPSTLDPRKLAHEFDEYRPYKSMTDFTREMAKYVSDEEVAFLTRYVTLD